MGNIVNLRQFKKRNERQIKEAEAEKNRMFFGKTKVEKNFNKREKEKDSSFLENNRLQATDKPKID